MRYRIRLTFNKWWLYIFDRNGKNVECVGPFEKIEQAEEAAIASGHKDWDKENG